MLLSKSILISEPLRTSDFVLETGKETEQAEKKLRGLSDTYLLGFFPACLMERWGPQNLDTPSFRLYKSRVSST